ncbi:MAG: hypothetical protein IKI21_11040 [Oscillospiraceae bacterium]|nr:hypothetical protein [Oscillospiraceae bacterium]
MKTTPTDPEEQDLDALVDMLDSLCEQGSQHIRLTPGDALRVQTVNSTECSGPGPCAVPNLGGEDPEDDD